MSQEGFDKLKKECVNAGLCVECGACSVVCPTGAIKLVKYPWGRNPELAGKCPDEYCDRCSTVCPGSRVELRKIEETFFGRAARPGTSDEITGIYRSVYTGFAKDQATRDAAVSGGFISALLIFALEKKMIDGAVLAGFDPECPYEAKACVATTREQVLAAAGSKYQPHPQLLGIADAMKMGLKRLAITTTPCHAVAVRNMMMKVEFKDFGSRIALLLSNICGAHWSRHGTEELIKGCGVKLEDVAALKYRARPFPGDFRIDKKNGETVISPFVNHLLGQLAKFTPEECRLCLEKVGLTADIVVGDTWHHPKLHPGFLAGYTDADVAADERIAEARKGVSAVVVRSEIGQKFVDAAIKGNAVKMYQDTPKDAAAFLEEIYRVGKIVCNGPVVAARVRRGLPVRTFC